MGTLPAPNPPLALVNPVMFPPQQDPLEALKAGHLCWCFVGSGRSFPPASDGIFPLQPHKS